MHKAHLFLIALTVCTSCNDDDPPAPVYPPPFPSRGYALEYQTGFPVPYASISVIEPGLFGSTVISSFQSDSAGEFNVNASRSEYIIHANDPNTSDIYNYGQGTGQVKNDSLICIMYPGGWIRYFVNDTLPLNPEITEISHGPPGTDGSMQYIPSFYPSQYDVISGFVQPATAFQNYSIPVKFVTGNDGIAGSDSLGFLSVYTLRFDTLDIYIKF